VFRTLDSQPPVGSKRKSGRKERVCDPWPGLISHRFATHMSHNHALALFLMVDSFLTDSLSVKDKANHVVMLDKATSDKLNKDVQSYRFITVAVFVDRLKINGCLERKAPSDLEERDVIKKIVGHSRGSIYTRAAAGGD
jgi:small subunit ribosomal protein S25e